MGRNNLDGYAVARAIRSDPVLRPTRLVALTGYGRDQDQNLALDAGFDVHLRKPTDVDLLRRTLARLLEPARGDRQP